MNMKICKGCGYIGMPIKDEISSFSVDIFVWLLVFSVSVITGIIPLIVLAPIYSLYHLFNFRSKKCPECKNLEMVGLFSRQGQKILKPHKGGIQPWSEHTRGSASNITC